MTEKLVTLVAYSLTSAKDRIGLLTWSLSKESIKKVVLARASGFDNLSALVEHQRSFSPAKLVIDGKTDLRGEVPSVFVRQMKVSFVIPYYNERDAEWKKSIGEIA